jgi:hypothetical protein
MLGVKQTDRGWVFNLGATVADRVLSWKFDGIDVCPQCSGHPAFYEPGDPCHQCGFPGGCAVPLPLTTEEAHEIIVSRDAIWRSHGYHWEQEQNRLRAAGAEITRAAYLSWRERYERTAA